MHRRKVDFPDPEGPIKQVTWPGITTRSIPESTSKLPYDFLTPSATNIGSTIVTFQLLLIKVPV